MTTTGVSENVVGKNIAYLRKMKGWTQEQFSTKLGVKQSAVSKFEVHGDKLRSETLSNIADALDVDMSLLYMEDLHDEDAEYHDIIVDAIKSCSKDVQRQMVFANIEYELAERRLALYKGESVTPEEMDVINLFNKLNPSGQREATKRVEELTLLDQYKKNKKED